MRNEKGFSLIELIIVVALMGIILGFATVGIGTLSNQRGKTAAKDIYNMIGSAQNVAMSKENCYLVLTANSVSVMYNSSTGGWTTLQESSISNSVSVYYDGTLISDEYPGIVISFNRATGAFSKFYEYDTAYETYGTSPIGTEIGSVSTIMVGTGDRAVRIVLYKSTGKYEIKYGETD